MTRMSSRAAGSDIDVRPSFSRRAPDPPLRTASARSTRFSEGWHRPCRSIAPHGRPIRSPTTQRIPRHRRRSTVFNVVCFLVDLLAYDRRISARGLANTRSRALFCPTPTGVASSAQNAIDKALVLARLGLYGTSLGSTTQLTICLYRRLDAAFRHPKTFWPTKVCSRYSGLLEGPSPSRTVDVSSNLTAPRRSP
jgi:hypothetical protein